MFFIGVLPLFSSSSSSFFFNQLTSLSSDQRRAVDLALSGQSLFFTGSAGTGIKRTVIMAAVFALSTFFLYSLAK